ncbi:MAG: site-specific integrase [Planctomycetaceae bacterium]|nr:site-specific integrase [Planctomycetaceae bacterium]
MFGKHDDKTAFQTWAQIERQIARDGLNEYEAEPLWQTLYLDASEIKKLLKYIREKATYGFLHPMCVLAGHTGARRSELCRARVADVDLEDSTIAIRERKRAQHQRTTRVVPLTLFARGVLADWLDEKEASPFLFPEPYRVDRERGEKAEPGAVSPKEASEHLNWTLATSRWDVIPGWHVLRHSFISNCACRVVDQRFIDAWVGHQTDEQRMRRQHLFPDSQQQAIDSVFV